MNELNVLRKKTKKHNRRSAAGRAPGGARSRHGQRVKPDLVQGPKINVASLKGLRGREERRYFQRRGTATMSV